jgi:hypothetical protein
MSQSNVPWLNPVIIQRTIAESGANLARGMRNQDRGLRRHILFAGFALSRIADAIAKQTGLGSNYIGLVLVGLATALPSLGSMVAAVRLERFEMAISDVFGANLFSLGLVMLANAVFAGGPITPDGESAEAAAIAEFKIGEDQRRRLVVRE